MSTGYEDRLRDGKIDRVHEYFDLDTARRVTGQKN
jgi:ketosteroid isomerase-like protein